MNHIEIRELIDLVEWADGRLRVVGPVTTGFWPIYLQAEATVLDADTGRPYVARGRKWHLSEHMTRGEVVQTAFKAVLAFVEHEAREAFRYRGQAIFGPHFDVDALAGFAADNDNWTYRKEAA